MINVSPLRVIFLYIRKISHKAAHSSSRLSNGTQYNGRIVRTAQRTLLIKSFRNDFSLPFLFIFISFFYRFLFAESALESLTPTDVIDFGRPRTPRALRRIAFDSVFFSANISRRLSKTARNSFTGNNEVFTRCLADDICRAKSRCKLIAKLTA